MVIADTTMSEKNQNDQNPPIESPYQNNRDNSEGIDAELPQI
jgi:hypothetical protein